MYSKAQNLFYMLSGFLLLTGFFVLSPNNHREVATLQTQIKHEFRIAWQQTIGDQSYFTELAEIWSGIESFYDQTATHTIALIQQRDSDADIAYVYGQIYHELAGSFQHIHDKSLAQTQQRAIDLNNFMSESAITNIVPTNNLAQQQVVGAVAGLNTMSTEPVNKNNSWVTIEDNYTGQLYCLAIYNNEVNKYLGPCKYDYH